MLRASGWWVTAPRSETGWFTCRPAPPPDPTPSARGEGRECPGALPEREGETTAPRAEGARTLPRWPKSRIWSDSLESSRDWFNIATYLIVVGGDPLGGDVSCVRTNIEGG